MTDNNMKNRYIFRLLVLAVMMSSFMACSKDDQFQHVQKEVDGGALLPMSDMKVHPLGDSFKVLYTASDSWTVSKDEDWITLKDSQGRLLTSGKAGSTQ